MGVGSLMVGPGPGLAEMDQLPRAKPSYPDARVLVHRVEYKIPPVRPVAMPGVGALVHDDLGVPRGYVNLPDLVPASDESQIGAIATPRLVGQGFVPAQDTPPAGLVERQGLARRQVHQPNPLRNLLDRGVAGNLARQRVRYESRVGGARKEVGLLLGIHILVDLFQMAIMEVICINPAVWNFLEPRLPRPEHEELPVTREGHAYYGLTDAHFFEENDHFGLERGEVQFHDACLGHVEERSLIRREDLLQELSRIRGIREELDINPVVCKRTLPEHGPAAVMGKSRALGVEDCLKHERGIVPPHVVREILGVGPEREAEDGTLGVQLQIKAWYPLHGDYMADMPFCKGFPRNRYPESHTSSGQELLKNLQVVPSVYSVPRSDTPLCGASRRDCGLIWHPWFPATDALSLASPIYYRIGRV